MAIQTSILRHTSIPCPLCGSILTVRTSRQLTEVLREEYVDCSNHLCPGRFKVSREIVASLFEGSYDHGLKLPQSLRKQALATPPAPDPIQLQLPGLDPEPPPDLSCYSSPPGRTRTAP